MSRYGFPSTKKKSALTLSLGCDFRIGDGMATLSIWALCWFFFRTILPCKIGTMGPYIALPVTMLSGVVLQSVT